eukprot:352888-Chlamydomonas_euryale.AAC.3
MIFKHIHPHALVLQAASFGMLAQLLPLGLLVRFFIPQKLMPTFTCRMPHVDACLLPVHNPRNELRSAHRGGSSRVVIGVEICLACSCLVMSGQDKGLAPPRAWILGLWHTTSRPPANVHMWQCWHLGETRVMWGMDTCRRPGCGRADEESNT